MIKPVGRIWTLIPFLLILSGCGPEAVFIPDIAFTMGFDQYDEESLSREFPDPSLLFEGQGFRTSLFPIDPSRPLWEAELAERKAALFVWAPLRGLEAVRFHREYPGTSGLWLSLGDSLLASSVPENLTVLIPRHEKVWIQLNSVLIKEGYQRVAGVFSSAASEGPGAADFISQRLEWFFPVTDGDDPDETLAILKNQVSGKADLIILAAGEINARLYQELTHWQVPLILEAPFPGAEDNSLVKGLIVKDWDQGFKSLWGEDNQPAGGIHYFNSQLWWRMEKVLQPLE